MNYKKMWKEIDNYWSGQGNISKLNDLKKMRCFESEAEQDDIERIVKKHLGKKSKILKSIENMCVK